jgi:hypothetical protein
VDHYLQPIVKSLPNVIRDTTDFLKRLQDLGDIPEGAILCTMDVVGLYPHIPHLEGLSSMTKFAPAFANIFMAELENKMLAGYHLSPSVWFRFLDDIFFIWLHGKESLLEFLNYINNYHETIKYTWEYSERGVSYLDVRVELESGKLQTDVYSKPTDTHQYLDFKSCHPAHVKKAIPYAWSGGKIKTDL